MELDKKQLKQKLEEIRKELPEDKKLIAIYVDDFLLDEIKMIAEEEGITWEKYLNKNFIHYLRTVPSTKKETLEREIFEIKDKISKLKYDKRIATKKLKSLSKK